MVGRQIGSRDEAQRRARETAWLPEQSVAPESSFVLVRGLDCCRGGRRQRAPGGESVEEAVQVVCV